jgi:hypothetical protein
MRNAVEPAARAGTFGLSCAVMAASRTPPWSELVQLVPVISLAFPFIAAGRVDLAQAGWGFLLGALLTVPVSALVLARGKLLNPILMGTALWLWLGAIAFQVPVPPLAGWLVRTQAFGLFVAAFLVGLIATFWFPQGYIARASSDPHWIRRASLGLLAFTGAVVVWAWLWRGNIRLGGGLPFIALNVTRRIVARRAPSIQDCG